MVRSPLFMLAPVLVVSGAVLGGCAANPRPLIAELDSQATHAEHAAEPAAATDAVDPHVGHTAETAASADEVVADALAEVPEGADLTGWFCPMHPDVTGSEPGKCTKCGMAFVLGNPYEMREYELTLTTVPAAVEPGIPFRMMFEARHPDTHRVVTNFEVVHDKQYHLFVVSQDLTSFQHLHPRQQSDGSWALDVTVPKAGYYRVLSDFLPTGGSPQFLGRSLVTAGFDGDLLSETALIEPDPVLERTVDSIVAEVELEPANLVAGEYGHLAFTLTDATTGEPIEDLEPYLGAFGHTLILSEDLQDYVHSHPTEEGVTSSVSEGHGGPHVTFEGYMPRPGRYRSWTQFQRDGELTTVPFTFRVYSLEEAVRLGR